MAADSRLVFKNRKEEILAYADGYQKLFPLKKYVFATAGNPIPYGIPVSHLLDRIDSSIAYDSPRDFINCYLDFARNSNKNLFEAVLKNLTYVAGYLDGFKIYQTKDGQVGKAEKGFMSNYFSLIDSLKPFDYHGGATCKELAPMVVKVMKEVIKIRD